MIRPWSDIPINDCGEELVQVKPYFYCLEPHPYLSLGAPYLEDADPWRLRSGVINRLNLAQEFFVLDNPHLRFAIFDAWRPISVQAFMVDHSINQLCFERDLVRNDQSQVTAINQVVEEVANFWATPSLDPSMPPPHSTGAAIDLTIADSEGYPLDMGGEIDQIGPVSFPTHYLEKADHDFVCHLYNQRRVSLSNVMEKAGFVQHPHEWWHFSFGDQLWAWKSNNSEAIYGACNPSESKESTACSPKFST